MEMHLRWEQGFWELNCIQYSDLVSTPQCPCVNMHQSLFCVYYLLKLCIYALQIGSSAHDHDLAPD